MKDFTDEQMKDFINPDFSDEDLRQRLLQSLSLGEQAKRAQAARQEYERTVVQKQHLAEQEAARAVADGYEPPKLQAYWKPPKEKQ